MDSHVLQNLAQGSNMQGIKHSEVRRIQVYIVESKYGSSLSLYMRAQLMLRAVVLPESVLFNHRLTCQPAMCPTGRAKLGPKGLGLGLGVSLIRQNFDADWQGRLVWSHQWSSLITCWAKIELRNLNALYGQLRFPVALSVLRAKMVRPPVKIPCTFSR